MNKTNEQLKEIKENGINITTSNVMSEAFIYYKKTFFSASAGLMLITFLASFLISSILVKIYGEDTEAVLKEMQSFNPFTLSLKGMSIYLLGMTIFTAITSVFSAGFIKMSANAYIGKRSSMLVAFKYFISIRGLYVFIAQFIVSILFSSIIFLLQSEGLNLVAMAINWLINTLIIFSTPLIIFAKQSPFEAIKNSIQVVNKQPVAIIFTLLLNYFLVGAGLLIFLVGIFFTLPYLFCIIFTLYRQTIGYYPEEEN